MTRQVIGLGAMACAAALVAGCRGDAGPAGTAGTACWDLDANGACDLATEDVNGDGACDAHDCYGQAGVACWDLDANNVCDLATEDVNGDGVCSALDCAGAPGTPGVACWDLDANGTCDLATEDVNGDGACTTADCAVAVSDGTVTGHVVDGADADVAGATVTFAPGAATATTGTDGVFTAAVPIGVYSLTVSAAGFADGTASDVSVTAGTTTDVGDIALTAVNPLTADAGPDQLQVGYGASVALSGSGAGAADLTYSWAQTSGPPASIADADTATPTVTMPTLDDVLASFTPPRALDDRTQLLPIGPAIQGSVVLTLTVSGGGFTATDSVTITAAEPTGGVLDVPVGINVFFQAAEAASYDWTLTPPAGDSTMLRDAASRTPSFIPDTAGAYTIALSGGPSFTVTVGTWVGTGGGTPCTDCHDGRIAPDKFTPWSGTKHATMFARGIDGLVSSHYSAACEPCHTVGYDKAANNGGFDDAATAAGWTFPATLAAGNWAAMQTDYPTVARLANIQCESCHGPNGSAAHPYDPGSRESLSEGVCGRCHDSPPGHSNSEQWRTTPHADVAFAQAEGVSSTSCTRCHGAQGYLAYSDRLAAGNPAPFTSTELTALGITAANVEPQTCTTCHDPHDATNPNQLRTYDSIAMLPAGFGVAGVGKGAVCMTCHNTRNGLTSTNAPFLHDDAMDPALLTSYSGPHAPSQTDVLMGENAFFVGPGGFGVSRHAAIADTCVACHMSAADSTGSYGGHTWRIGTDTCTGCHGAGVDGAGIQETVRDRLSDIEALIANRAVSTLAGIVGGGGTWTVRAYDAATDCYSSSSSSSSNVAIDQVPSSATMLSIHGQTSFCFDFDAPPISSWTRASTGCSGTVDSPTEICVQVGSLKTGSPLAAVFAPTDVLIKAAWNDSLLKTDGSFGIHNPSWVLDVLRATYEALQALP